MESHILALFVRALGTAALLALPLVCAIALVGVLVGIAQTIVQVQDQNVAFAPKLSVVAFALVAGGAVALDVLRSLLVEAAGAAALLGRG